MDAVLCIIGGIWIVVGTLAVLYTNRYRRAVTGLTGKVPSKVLALFPLVMGVLLMISARASHSFWLAEILGILGVAKGVFLFGLGRERVQRLFSWWQEKLSEVAWRFCGLVLVILGVFLVLRI